MDLVVWNSCVDIVLYKTQISVVTFELTVDMCNWFFERGDIVGTSRKWLVHSHPLPLQIGPLSLFFSALGWNPRQVPELSVHFQVTKTLVQYKQLNFHPKNVSLFPPFKPAPPTVSNRGCEFGLFSVSAHYFLYSTLNVSSRIRLEVRGGRARVQLPTYGVCNLAFFVVLGCCTSHCYCNKLLQIWWLENNPSVCLT